LILLCEGAALLICLAFAVVARAAIRRFSHARSRSAAGHHPSRDGPRLNKALPRVARPEELDAAVALSRPRPRARIFSARVSARQRRRFRLKGRSPANALSYAISLGFARFGPLPCARFFKCF